MVSRLYFVDRGISFRF